MIADSSTEKKNVRNRKIARHMWLMPATQEAEIRRIAVRSQIAHETLSQKTHDKKIWAGGVAQGEEPEFKLQYCKKRKQQENYDSCMREVDGKL
jgi:hypothetical protein